MGSSRTRTISRSQRVDRGRAHLAIFFIAVLATGFVVVADAHAKDRLTIKAMTVPSDFTPEQVEAGYPTTGKGLRGRLDSATPACERGRPLVLHYQHAFSEGLTTQDFYSGNGRVKTGRNGAWATVGALNLLYSYSPNLVRVSVSVARRGSCSELKSPTIRVPAVVVSLPTGATD